MLWEKTQPCSQPFIKHHHKHQPNHGQWIPTMANHEHIQEFDEVVSTQQQCWYATLSYFIPKTCVPTSTIIFIGLQNQ
jgi:hypothetical protein